MPDDRLGLWAQYYLARIPHIHAFELDYGEAVRRYLALIRKHGLSYPGQRALCKYAILRLFVLGGDQDSRRSGLAELEENERNLTIPGTAVQFLPYPGQCLPALRLGGRSGLSLFTGSL